MDLINGLPAHILLVHFVVAGVPLAALVTVLSSVWPAARARLGIFTPLIAFGSVVSVVLAKNAGEWLQRHIATTDLVKTHTRLGAQLLPFSLGLFLVSVAAWGLPWWVDRKRRATTVRPSGEGTSTSMTAPGDTVTTTATTVPSALVGTPVRAIVAVLAIVFGLVATIQMYRIGDSGSTAAWKSGIVCRVEMVDNNCPNGDLIQP